MSGDVDKPIGQITVAANGEAEQLWAFRQALEDHIAVPCDAAVIGAPVTVIRFDFDGNVRRGLTAICRGAGGALHQIAAADVVIPPESKGAQYLAAYRKWLGVAAV